MMIQRAQTFVRYLLICLTSALVAPGAGHAAEQSAFFKGKLVRIIVGYVPGGGFDVYARMIAPELASQLGATVVVENKPGAGGLNALAALTRTPGTGLEILVHNGEPALLNQIIDPAGPYDVSKLALLARISFERRVLVVRKGSPLERINAFLEPGRQFFFGAGDRVDSFGDPASIFCNAMNIECKLVLGFPGASLIALAVARGELDAFITSESQSASLARGGEHTAVAVLSDSRAPLLPGVPLLKELASISPESYKWIKLRSDVAEFGRVLVVPADTPADRVATLRRALSVILTDPAFIKHAAETNRPISYAAPAELEKTAQKFTQSLTDRERSEIRYILMQKY